MINRSRRQRVCFFCSNQIDDIDYKDEKTLFNFITDRGKIMPRRVSGTCAKHQRKLSTAIKRARYLAILPYIRDYNR
jgi:small subunit ribosomal protein S18